MKVNIKALPKGYSIVNGKVYRDGGSTTGDQSNYGLVQSPSLDDSSSQFSPFTSVNYTLDPVPRDEANLEAEKGETVLGVIDPEMMVQATGRTDLEAFAKSVREKLQTALDSV